MHKFFQDIAAAVRSAFFPDRCALCHKVISYGTRVCSECRKTAPVIRGQRCPVCGIEQTDCKCGKRACFYEGITAPFLYRNAVKTGIRYWKYDNYIASTPFFAEMVAAAVQESFSAIDFDFIAYVPQTKKEEAEKQYNQAFLLSRETGKRLKIPTETVLVKLYETSRQHDVSVTDKSGNVFGVFDCIQTEKIKDSTILLLDDIRTSGNTLNECAKMLSLYGAKNVYCAVIAITEK